MFSIQSKTVVKFYGGFMAKAGFTLVELLIVIALIAILLATISLNFNSMTRKYSIDAQTREMVADLSEARMAAIHRKSNVMVAIDSNRYEFKIYSTNESVSRTAGRSFFNKTLKNPIQFSGDIGFNNRGLTEDFVVGGTFNSKQTISVITGGVNAALDCLVVSTARVNIGRMNGSNCEFK